MQILGLLGMYFDAVVVEVKTCLLLFRLALAILWSIIFSQFKKKGGQNCPWRPHCKQNNNSKSVYNNLVCSILCHSLNKIGLCWLVKKCDKYCSEEVNATPYLYIPNDGNSQHLEKSRNKNNNNIYFYICMLWLTIFLFFFFTKKGSLLN